MWTVKTVVLAMAAVLCGAHHASAETRSGKTTRIPVSGMVTNRGTSRVTLRSWVNSPRARVLYTEQTVINQRGVLVSRRVSRQPVGPSLRRSLKIEVEVGRARAAYLKEHGMPMHDAQIMTLRRRLAQRLGGGLSVEPAPARGG